MLGLPPIGEKMSDFESVLVAHYDAVRSEIIERIRLRDQYLVYFAAISAAAFGVFIKDPSWWGLLLTVPVLAFLTGMLYAHTDIIIGDLGIWLRTEYTKSLDRLIECNNADLSLSHWDGSETNLHLFFSASFSLRYYSICIFLFFSSFISTLLVEPYLTKSAPNLSNKIVLLFNAISLGAAIMPYIALASRRNKKKRFLPLKKSK